VKHGLDGGNTIIDLMLDQASVTNLLAPFELHLSQGQTHQLLVYLELLLRWNPRINLTSIRDPEEIVTRHFGESLYIGRWARLQGNLLDIGSGAGFPGLALKIAFPDLATTLLEPVAKKRAFLKEVVRACDFRSVEVRPERLEEFALESGGRNFSSITARAVGHFELLVPAAAKILSPDGRILLWVSRQQGNELKESSDRLEWQQPIAVPMGREREIYIGQLKRETE
jgi:16S rRNA (guanine527-N7)-methyltransferase